MTTTLPSTIVGSTVPKSTSALPGAEPSFVANDAGSHVAVAVFVPAWGLGADT